MDENLLIDTCKGYYEILNVKKNHNRVAFAGKAFFNNSKCVSLVNEEGLYLDVVSGGELYTAYKAGFPLKKCIFMEITKH